jgi:hypothetical protein
MTVTKKTGRDSQAVCECSWFVNGVLHTGTFTADALMDAYPEKTKSN